MQSKRRINLVVAMAVLGLALMPAARAECHDKLKLEIEGADRGRVIINAPAGVKLTGDERMIEQFVRVRPLSTTTTVVAPGQTLQQGQINQTFLTAPATELKTVATYEDVRDLSEAKPYFCDRVTGMREWLSLGVDRGFLTQSEADMHLSELNRISAMLPPVLDPDFDTAKSDEIEKALNLLYIDVAANMSGPSIAAGGSLQ